MRTIYTITTKSEVLIKYYEADESLVDSVDRYSSDREPSSQVDRMTQAVWGGTLAQEEHLKGHITREDFMTILRGTLPGSDQRIRGERPNPEDKERLADDVVLSAPKSYSMALHLEGDIRLFDAHMEAATETLRVIEPEFAQTRIQVDGLRQTVHTGKLLAVLMPHHTSREGDMQLHLHMLIMNGTKGPDGIWRSLSHETLTKAEWTGSFYRQRLAEKSQALGYRVYPTKHGFELQGYSRDEIQVFSKRNQAIVEGVRRAGLTVNAKNKQQKVLPTRKAKSKSGKTLEEIQVLWRAEAHAKKVGQPVLDYPIHVQPKLETAVQEVNRAIQDLSEQSLSFSRDDIYAHAFEQVHPEGLSFEQINQAINQHTSLLDMGNGRLTTAHALEQEIEIRQRWMAGQGKATPLCPNPDLKGTQLNSGQTEAVSRTLLLTDKHQIIPRLSRFWKTKVLGELTRQLQETGVEIRGFSPTNDTAAELQKLGIKTNTVEHLVASQPEQVKNQLWIIDKAGMINAKQILDIQRQADAVEARILLVGDKGQGSTVAVGSPLRSLINHGATTHSIGQLIRQQNSIQRQALELIAAGHSGPALELLGANGYITEIADPGVRAAAIADQYLALPPKERNQTLIKAGTKDECSSITEAIRTGLTAEGTLGKSIKAVQLVSRQSTDDQSLQIGNYQDGDYIRLHRDYRSTPLQKGQLYKVEERKGDELIVSSYGGRLFRFNPGRYKDKTVFQAQEVEIAVGDRLRWTFSDKNQGQINGKAFSITSIESTTLSLIDHQGQSHDVSLFQPLAIDYNWVSTLDQAQSKTARRVIISASNDLTSAQEPFYINISRQVRDVRIYTEDLRGLHEIVQGVSQAIPLELRGGNCGSYRSQKRLAANLKSGEVSRAQLSSDYQITETQEHAERMKGGEPKQHFFVVKKQVISEEQEKLNRQALGSSKQLLRKFGSVQPSGELSCTLGSYTFCADLKGLCVSCHQRGSILQMQGGQLCGNILRKDVQRFESLEKALKQNILAQSIELD